MRVPAISQRMHLVLLTAWTVLWFVVVEPNGGFSWHYLRTGGELIYQGSSGDAPAASTSTPTTPSCRWARSAS